MIVAVASGKGGTGKTTVAVNLASVFDEPVQLLDCDVEEPNTHLFVPGEVVSRETVTVPLPEVDLDRCTHCGECSRFCEFHAIVSLEKQTLVFPDLCHGCGGCAKVCPERAIREVDQEIGGIETRQAGQITLVGGRLKVGTAMLPPLTRAVRAKIQSGMSAILDAPPGTSCPAVAAVRSVDFVVLVTEPTPFGLHDLTLAVDLVRDRGLPFGVVVNRAGVGDERVHAYCEAEDIPILAELPNDRRVAEAYSSGALIVKALPEYRDHFKRLLANITGRVGANRQEEARAASGSSSA